MLWARVAGTMTYIGFQGTEKDDLWFVVRRNTLFFVVSNLPCAVPASLTLVAATEASIIIHKFDELRFDPLNR